MDAGPGLHVVTPWAGSDLDWTARELTGRIAVTRREPAKTALPGLEIVRGEVGLAPRVARDAVDDWVRDAGRALLAVYGEAPVPRIQLIVVWSHGRKVGFGMTARGGGSGVVVFVGRDVLPAALAADWTLTHELIHLGMPRLQRGHEWFSEGITSYLTYVGRARAELMPAVDAWSELHDGFVRGRATRTGRTLKAESAAMQRTSAYWPVYWGGAAWALAADVALRRTGGSLDEVLTRWRNLGHLARWYPAETLIQTAHESFPKAQLPRLTESFLSARPLPRTLLDPLYEALGLQPDGQRVILKHGPDAPIRDAIMGAE